MEPAQAPLGKRLDRLPWTAFHTTVLVALGVGWALDGFEVSIIGPMLGELSKIWHLAVWQGSLIASIFLFGAFFGTLFFSYLADRLGRKKLFVTTLLLYGLFTFLSAFAWNFPSLLTMRFLTGLGIGGEYGAVNAAIDEFIPARYRGRSDGAVNASWSVGSLFASLVSMAVLNLLPPDIGWRFAFLFGALIAAFVAVIRRAIPESPRWLIARGRTQTAEHIVRTVESQAGAHGLHAYAGSEPHLHERGEAPRTYGQSLGYLFRHYRGRTILSWLLNIGEAAPYYGLLTVLPLVILPQHHIEGGQVAGFFLFGSTLGLLGALSVAWLSDTLGRKPSVTLGYGMSTLAPLLLALTSHSLLLLYVVYGAMNFFGQMSGTGAYIVTSEIFPTSERALGVGLAVAVGRVASMTAPIAFAAIYALSGTLAVYLSMAGIAGIGFLAMIWWNLTGPEAKGRSIEEVSPEAGLAARESEASLA